MKKELLLKGIEFIKNSGIIGYIESARIKTCEVEIRGDNNNEVFEKNNGIPVYGNRIPCSTYEAKFEETKINLKLIVWTTKKFGAVLTTSTDMIETIKKVINLELGNKRNCKDRNIIIDKLTYYVLAAQYNDVLGSVTPIFSYENDNEEYITIYLDGSVTIDNEKQEWSYTNEELAEILVEGI